jgi:DNA polymerase V
MFALVDCNNFYASCERVFRPDLNGRPVVVLSNNDGCVIARSNEAKKAGVPMGAPAYQYKQLFETQHIEVFSANFALYGDMSNRVMSILGMFCQNIEIYSIDEAFMNFNGYNLHDLEELGTKIKKQGK